LIEMQPRLFYAEEPTEEYYDSDKGVSKV